MEECPRLHARYLAGVAGGEYTKQRPNEPLRSWSGDKLSTLEAELPHGGSSCCVHRLQLDLRNGCCVWGTPVLLANWL